MIAAGGGMVSVISLAHRKMVRSAPLERAGALCASQEKLFCAYGADIACLHRHTLCAQTSFAAGPGVSEIMLSQDGGRLYALCADGSSVLMLHAASGSPLVLAPAGVNPRQMTLDGGLLAIAGGESSDVILLCAKTLRQSAALSMPGPVYSVAMNQKRIYALCMTPRLSSLLVTLGMGGDSSIVPLYGMPGRLLLLADALYAATYGWLYRIAPDGETILRRSPAPGKAAWLAGDGCELLLLDDYSQTLFITHDEGESWNCLSTGVCKAALCDT